MKSMSLYDEELTSAAIVGVNALATRIQFLSEELARQNSEREGRIAMLEGRLRAIVNWLETNQEDVFRRGIWDAINEAKP